MAYEFDEAERRAHHAICYMKYGGYGGSVPTRDVIAVGNIIRGGPKPMAIPKIKLTIPKVVINAKA